MQMPEPFERILMHEYFYKRLTELDEEQRSIIYTMRTKRGLLILCDRLRALELEKLVLMRVYEDMKGFF